MASYQFEIPGKPRAKQSARAVRTANGVRFFQPTEITNYHGRISALARQTIPAPLEGPIALRVSIVLQTPASWSKKRRALWNPAVARPDLDNSLKALMDGLNGVAWLDDKQVVELAMTKAYGTRDAVIIHVRELP